MCWFSKWVLSFLSDRVHLLFDPKKNQSDPIQRPYLGLSRYRSHHMACRTRPSATPIDARREEARRPSQGSLLPNIASIAHFTPSRYMPTAPCCPYCAPCFWFVIITDSTLRKFWCWYVTVKHQGQSTTGLHFLFILVKMLSTYTKGSCSILLAGNNPLASSE